MTLGGLVGEHREAAGQGSADSSSHSHPVCPSNLALPQVEWLRGSADVHHLPGSPSCRVGEKAKGEEDSREHLNGATECEYRAAEAVAAAGREQRQHHREDHDGQPYSEAGNASFPSMGELIIILTEHLLLQFVKIGNTLSFKNQAAFWLDTVQENPKGYFIINFPSLGKISNFVINIRNSGFE